MKIYESAEDYLEAILMLKQQHGYVRSIDIANTLSFSKPSVSVAMKHLEEDGYIQRDDDRFISLTDKGLAIAERIYERHETLAHWFISIGVDEETAYKDACKIEHDLSVETFDKLRAYIAGGK